MKATLVLTLIGLDKPGLVKAISNTATRHGANWEASRMARLGGRFAGLLLVTLEPSRARDAFSGERASPQIETHARWLPLDP